MSPELINSIACGLVALWATWCVLSGKVRDGIIGKLIYSAIAISRFVVKTRNQTLFFGPTDAALKLHVSLCFAGMRHAFMVLYWPSVRNWLCVRLNCKGCHPPGGPQITQGNGTAQHHLKSTGRS